MGASAVLLRAEARGRWRSFALGTLVIGLAAGAVLLTATSARRSSTAYARFLEWAHPADFYTGGGSDDDLTSLLAALPTAPFTEDYVRICAVDVGLRAPAGNIFAPFQLPVVGAIDATVADRRMERTKLLDGREPDPSRPDEAVMDFAAADRAGLHVGDRIELVRYDGQGSLFVTLVGTGAAAGSFPTLSGVSNNSVMLTKAFYDAHPDLYTIPGGLGMGVRVKPGTTRDEVEAFLAAHGPTVDVFTPESNVAAVERTIGLETNATWVIVAVLAVVVLVLSGQLLVRQAANVQEDASRLMFLGLRRRDVVRLGAARAALQGLVAAAIAVAGTALVSPLTPVGLAGKAEPDPGVWIDWTVLALGALCVVAVCTALGALGTMVVHRRATLAGGAAGRWMPLPGGAAPVVIGSHFLTRPARAGEARTARTTAIAVALLLALLVGTSVVLQSLVRLSNDEVLSGSSWNGVLVPTASDGEQASAEDVEATLQQVRADPVVTAASRGGWVSVTVDGRDVPTQVFEDGGQIQPVIAQGRVPTAAGEIAMGVEEMGRLGAGIGSVVLVQGRQDGDVVGDPVPVRIVGQSVLRQPIFLQGNVGDGIAMPNATAQLLDGDVSDALRLVLTRFADGVSPEAGVARLQRDLPDAVELGFSSTDRSITASVEQVRTLPEFLLVVLAVVCGAGLSHLLVTSFRRRRSDLAVLRTLGLTPRQAAQSLAVQALGYTVLALVPGVVLDLVAGGLFWRAFAGWLGVVSVVVTGRGWLAVTAAGVVLLGQLAVIAPAWRAARIKPADLLRAD